jgi:NAD(P)-dependent dehydrogenase (short-subunit alcohol dehydrogenase family)
MAQCALITGAAKRIGKCIALTLARQGCDIALHYHTSRDEAQASAAEIRATGVRCEPICADLADPAQAAALVRRAADAIAAPSLLVNNASIFVRRPLDETDADLLDLNMAIHVRAPMLLTREFARLCGRGLIVNVLDAKISRPNTAYFAYELSKRALAQMTLMSASALAPGIRVCGVCPGMTLAPEGKDTAYLRRLSEALPLKRAGHPQQVADAVVYLMRNDYITGQILYLDGGEHLGDDIRVPEDSP